MQIFKQHKLYFLLSFIFLFIFMITLLFNSVAIYTERYSLHPVVPIVKPVESIAVSIFALANGGTKDLVAQPLAWVVLFGGVLALFMFRFTLRRNTNYIEGIIMVLFVLISFITFLLIPNYMKDPNFSNIYVYLLPLYKTQIVLLSLILSFSISGSVMSYFNHTIYEPKYRFHRVYDLKKNLHDWKI